MPRRPLSFDTFDQAIHEIERLQVCGYQKTGNWTLGQMCQHLALSMERPMEGITSRAPLPIRLLGPMMRKSFFRARSMRAGFRIPPPLRPEDAVDELREVYRLIAALRRIELFPGPFPRHPVLGKLSLTQWRDLQLIHTAHHLSFLIPKEDAVAANQAL
jgi:hypothetical protein